MNFGHEIFRESRFWLKGNTPPVTKLATFIHHSPVVDYWFTDSFFLFNFRLSARRMVRLTEDLMCIVNKKLKSKDKA